MIFGDPERFAVELELDEAFHGPWLFGKIGYWIGSQRAGNWEPGISLRDAIWSLTRIVKDNGHRQNEHLCREAPAASFNTIHAVFFGDQDLIPEELAERAAAYDVTPDVGFDEWTVYLVEYEGRARLLCRDPEQNLREIILSSGEFDNSIRAAFDQLDAWYEREAPDDMA